MMAELNDRCFDLLLYGRHVGAICMGTNLHTEALKNLGGTLPNNARMNYRTNLNFGEVVYISIIFHIPVLWINLLNGYDFHFWWRDTANQPYAVIWSRKRGLRTVERIQKVIKTFQQWVAQPCQCMVDK